MCRHVAATLYGIGVRLDTDASVLFKMRGFDMLDNMKNSSARMFKGIDLPEVSGMEVLESEKQDKAAEGKLKVSKKAGKVATEIHKNEKMKRSKDFTEEEKAEILQLGRKIGWKAAARKAGTTIWIIGKWRKEEAALLGQQQISQDEILPEENLLEEIKSEISHPQSNDFTQPLYEKLQQLMLENAVLKNELAMLTEQFNKVKAAIIHLL